MIAEIFSEIGGWIFFSWNGQNSKKKIHKGNKNICQKKYITKNDLAWRNNNFEQLWKVKETILRTSASNLFSIEIEFFSHHL